MVETIEEIILGDVKLAEALALEASSLVREVSDLHRLMFPVIKLWLANRGKIPGIRGVHRDKLSSWTVRQNNPPYWLLEMPFPVPNYWRLPALTTGSLALTLAFTQKPELKPIYFSMGGGTNRMRTGNLTQAGQHEYRYSLFIEVMKIGDIDEWHLLKLNFLRARLRSLLSHELEHIRDTRPETWRDISNAELIASLRQREQVGKFKRYADYLASPEEIWAKARDILEMAKQRRRPVSNEMERFLKMAGEMLEQRVASEEERASIPEIIERLRRAYTETLNARYPGWR